MQRLYSSQISPADDGKTVTVSGWVHTLRPMKEIAFLIIRDREGQVQATVIKNDQPALFEMLPAINRESVVRVTGKVVANKQCKRGFEIHPASIDVLSPAKTPLPLGVADKVGADLDTRLDNRFLDLRKPEIGALFRLRSLMCEGIREYLETNGFVEVATPKIVAAGAEGGATLFKLDYFGKPAYLAQSPQLYKQMLMASGLDRVYEIAPAFRAELSDTVRHISEFISYDAEIAHIESMEDVLQVLEGSVIAGLQKAATAGADMLKSLNIAVAVPKAPVPRVKYADVLKMLAEKGKPLSLGDDIDTESEKLLGSIMEKQGHDLYFITDYPEKIKPFYIMAEGDISQSFDLDYKGQEIASGGQREHRYSHLVARMQKMNLDPKSFEHYLKPFEYGMPPHGGWGLGIDRLAQKMLSQQNVREVVLFPRDRLRVVP